MAKQTGPSEQDKHLDNLRRKAVASMDLLEDARIASQASQDYYDGKHWSDEERRTLEARGQPALVFNHVKPAVNAIIGIVERGKTDPKAWGRTPKDQDAAEVATDSMRYCADITRLQSKKREALKDLLIWGTAACVVELDEQGELQVTRVKPEEYFYDPYSREADFSDVSYDGIAKWMDESDLIDLYPDKEKEIRASIDTTPMVNETFKDRPNRAWSWADRKTRRVMCFEMYHRRGADWHKCVFVANAILESGPSKYLDSNGRPKKCTIAQSAYVTRDNVRYGVIRDMIGPQDAINKARSKAVHILNVGKLRVDPGAMDVDDIRREWAKPDGILQLREGQVEELGEKQFAQAHLELLRDAKEEMRRQSPTPGIVGRGGASQSGRAILAEQQAGMTEQSPILAAFDDWVLRVYRALWEGVKQFWTDQKYIRVTDDENAPKFIMMNEPALMMDPNNPGHPMIGPDGQPVIDPSQPPRNQPAKMDVDIIIDSTPDTAVIQEEQFQKLAELVQGGIPIPPEVLIEASSLPKKRLLLDKMEEAKKAVQGQPGPEQAAAAAEQAKAQVQLQSKQAMTQIDAQAHAEELQRQDQADQAKTQRAQALEQQKFENSMQILQAQAQIDGVKLQQSLEADAVKQRNALEVEAQRKAMDLHHAGQQKEMDFSFQQREKETDAQRVQEGEVKKATAEAPHMTAIAKALDKMGEALKSLSAPRKLIKDPLTGEKRVEIDMGKMN